MSSPRALLLSLLLLSPAAEAHRLALVPEAPEPNASPTSCTSITCGDTGEGDVFPADDEDWWCLQVLSPIILSAFTGPGSSGAPIADTVLDLLDAAGNHLITNDDGPSRGLYSQIDRTLLPGTYFLNVRSFAGSFSGTYTLDLRCDAAVAEGPEPNNTTNSGTPVQCAQVGVGDIALQGDSDWWTLNLTAASLIILETAPGLTGRPIDNTILTLRDASGIQIASDDNGGPGLFSRIESTLSAGIYHVEVQGTGSNIGTYGVTIGCNPLFNLQCGIAQMGNIASTLQSDLYLLTIPNTGDVILTAQSTSSIDTAIELIDTSNDVTLTIGRQDSVNGNFDGRIEFRAMPPGTYRLRVFGESGTTGSYNLVSSCTLSAPINLPVNGGPVSGMLTGNGQADINGYIFNLTQPTEIVIDIDTPAVSGEPIRMWMTDILGNSDHASGDFFARMLYTSNTCTATPGSHIIALALPPGVFLVYVGRGRELTTCPGSQSTYNLTLTGNPIATIPINPGDVQFGFINGPQQDLYEYTSDTATELFYGIETPNTNMDLMVFLWDAAGFLVASDDDGGPGVDPYLQAEIFPGTHYFTVRELFLSGLGGPYEFTPGGECEIVGIGTAGSTIDLRWRGNENDQFRSFFSGGTIPPVAFAPPFMGSLLLSPVGLTSFTSGTFGMTGVFEITGIPVPGGLTGFPMSLQALNIDATFSTFTFTNVDTLIFP